MLGWSAPGLSANYAECGVEEMFIARVRDGKTIKVWRVADLLRGNR